MKPNPLRANWELVRLTETALRHGAEGLDSLPGMIKELLQQKAWERFELPNGEPVNHERFAKFVAADPPRGLGTSTEYVRQLIEKDPAALGLLDQVSDNVRHRQGNRKEAALRRLRRTRPDLHAKVLAGELSAHRAAVEAGFRHRTITVPTDDPERLAATLRRHLKPDDLAFLAELLGDG
jgi:hypothetical protein